MRRLIFMSKRRLVIIGIVVLLLMVFVGYFVLDNRKSNVDSVKFSKEYTKVSSNNVFVYRTPDEIIDIIKHGTGVVYLGFPGCPWCQAYVKYLNEVALDVGIEKIFYTNTKELKESDMDKYYEIVDLLEGYLQFNDEGKPWIFVPNVTFVINGRIIGNDNETSLDTHGLKDPDKYWTDDEVKDLKNRLKKYMNSVSEALNTCDSECNE